MTEIPVTAGWVLLGIGGFFILAAIILIIYLVTRSVKAQKSHRTKSQDAFKVVYKVPESHERINKVPVDIVDSRSELGYRHGTLSVRTGTPSVITSYTLPRATSVDHVTLTLPHTGQRCIVPTPDGTLPRVLFPVKKNKIKRNAKPLLVYEGRAASVLSAPGYVTSARSVHGYAPSVRSLHTQATTTRSANHKHYMYGSTPNLAAAQFTQPVLMYDANKRNYFANELVGGHSHVHNWLSREEPRSLPGDDELGRFQSVTSSPDVQPLDAQALHMRWSPSMRRRLEQMDKREREEETLRNMSRGVPGDERRYPAQRRYSEASEDF